MTISRFIRLKLGTGLSGTDLGDGIIEIDAAGGSGDVATDTIWDAKGDLAIGSGADAADNLPVGSNDQVLVADSAQTLGVKWAAVPGTGAFVPVATIDAKGDLLVGSANDALDNLPVGTNNHVLTADSAQTLGVKWAAVPGGGMAADTLWDAKGDLAVASAADTGARLAVGSDGQILTADSAQTLGVKWATPTAGSGSLKLFDSTLGADAATLDTGAGGIASGYAALDIALYARTADAGATAGCYLRFNADTGGTNYGYTHIRNNAGTAAATAIASDSGIEWYTAGNGATAGVVGAARFLVPNYTGTTFRKTVTGTSGYIDTTTLQQSLATHGQWKNTAAITRVAVLPQSGGNLKAGSRMVIWGLN